MGVVVVAAAGNDNDVPFITGAPATATKAISVAALDAFPTIPMATVRASGRHGHPGQQPERLPRRCRSAGTLHVVSDGTGGVSLGCTAADYDAGTAGKIVAIKRGVCAFVDKGAAAAAAGAIGIIDDQPGRHGARATCRRSSATSPSSSRSRWSASTRRRSRSCWPTTARRSRSQSGGTSAPNPTYQQIADFSSAGPRYGDNWLKPDVAAPGVNVCRHARRQRLGRRPCTPAPRWPPR